MHFILSLSAFHSILLALLYLEWLQENKWMTELMNQSVEQTTMALWLWLIFQIWPCVNLKILLLPMFFILSENTMVKLQLWRKGEGALPNSSKIILTKPAHLSVALDTLNDILLLKIPSISLASYSSASPPFWLFQDSALGPLPIFFCTSRFMIVVPTLSYYFLTSRNWSLLFCLLLSGP
jgi:hypothetical protein